MASSCTFIVRKKRQKDQVCWSTFCSLTNSVSTPQFMVIEPKKGPFDHDTKIQFLRDLRSMGFDFTYRTQSNGEIHINTSQLCKDGRQTKVLFGMYVRYLWEGSYGSSQGYYGRGKYDMFYKIIPIYFSLKTHFPYRNKFILLNIASALFAMFGYDYNANHFPSHNGWSVRMWDKIPKETMLARSSVNTVMSADDVVSNRTNIWTKKNFFVNHSKDLPKELTSEEASKIYKYFIKQKKNGN